MNSLLYTLNEERIDYSENPDNFFEICHTVVNTHAPKKKKYIRGNNKPFMTKANLILRDFCRVTFKKFKYFVLSHTKVMQYKSTF